MHDALRRQTGNWRFIVYLDDYQWGQSTFKWGYMDAPRARDFSYSSVTSGAWLYAICWLHIYLPVRAL